MKQYSENLMTVMNELSSEVLEKFGHNRLTTSHVFIAAIRFLNSAMTSSDTELSDKYRPLVETLKEVFTKYDITVSKFEKTLTEVTITTLNTGSIESDPEIDKLVKNLEESATKNRKTLDIEDLLFELFSHRGYYFVEVLLASIDKKYSFDDIRDDVLNALLPSVLTTIRELDKNPALTNLNRWVETHPQEYIGIEGSVKQLELGLSGRVVKNVVITGEPGVGKTSVVYKFVEDIVNKTCSAAFKNKLVYQLDPATLVAGTRFRGDFEAKLSGLLEILKKTPNVIIFVDEAHTMLTTGDSADGGGNTMGNILKPYLSRNEIQMIMATTSAEYDKHILPQKAFAERFHKVVVNEPSVAETKAILKLVADKSGEFFDKKYTDDLIDSIVTLSTSYSIDEANPRKAITLMDLAFSYSKIFNSTVTEVSVDDIIEAIRIKYDIKISKTKYSDTESKLKEVILGQDDAIGKILKNLKMVDAGLCDPEKPLLSMILAGPTGTGKTEACKQIAETYFGSKNNLIVVNCGEFSAEMDVSKITGAAPGYVGHDNETAFIRQIREKPNSLVLFDEIEKAHPAIMKVLLKILDEGEMTDSHGNRLSFRNAIVVFTTNLGYTNKDLDGGSMIGFAQNNSQDAARNKKIMEAIKKHFTPEFLGRIDDIIIYDRLSDEVVRVLIDRYIKFFNEIARSEISFSEEDYEEVSKNAKINTAGARGLKKAVRLKMSEKM